MPFILNNKAILSWKILLKFNYYLLLLKWAESINRHQKGCKISNLKHSKSGKNQYFLSNAITEYSV